MTQTVKIIKALADPTRIELLRYLVHGGGTSSCQEASSCSGLSQPTKSHHFGKLVEAGIISESKHGVAKTYAVEFDYCLAHGLDLHKIIN